MRSLALAGLASFGLAHALVATPAAADDVQKGPYLLHLTSTSVDVRVELPAPAPVTVTVSAGATDAGHAAPQPASSPSAAFHSVHLAGLAPATRYRYAVKVAGGAPHEGSFVTAPEGSSHAPFTFLVYGDNRTDGAAHARVAQAIVKESFDFLIQTGDLVNSGADEGAWQSFFDIEGPILRDHCLFAALGNHELAADPVGAHYERYFPPSDLAVGVGAGESAPPYGSFRWGRARFFVLNAFEEWGPGRERGWLEQALAEADHEAGVDLRVAIFHHGPYSAGPHGNNARLLDAHIDDLLAAHGVDLVLSGHDHIYERGQVGKLKYLVSGGAGAPLYREIKPLPSTRKVEATYHYILATVTDEGVAIVAKRPDGSIVDQCSFARGGSWLCDPAKAEVKALPEARRESPSAASLPPVGGMCACDAAGGRTPSGVLALVVGGLVLALRVRRRDRGERCVPA